MALGQETISRKRSHTHGKPIVIDSADFPEEWKQRWCNRCRRLRPLDEFHLDSSRADGIEYICKECSSAKSRMYRERNSERTR